jgi:alanine-glyoxylate transaminase / serine-glyoxylate transaminase / serine-pyruvate transaminase
MALPEPRLLLGPGPSCIHPRVLVASSRPPIGYLDPELFTLLATMQDGLRALFQTSNPFTIPLTGTGMAGMEFCLVNLLEPGETAVIAVNGFFGGRMAEIATRLGANVIRVDFPWGTPVVPEVVAEACEKAGKVALLGCVHAETSTGVASPASTMGAIAKQHGALFVLDTVTSLGGMEVCIDAWGVDASYSATQKCVGAPPGLSPVTLSPRAWEKVQSRTTPVPNWYLDAKLLDAYYHQKPAMYHHTVPVNAYFGLAEALNIIAEEGLPARWARHQACSDLLWSLLEPMGLPAFVPKEYRLPTLNAVALPDNIAANEVALRGQLLTDYGIEIGGGLGAMKGKLWRIGLMGHGAQPQNIHALAGALRAILG